MQFKGHKIVYRRYAGLFFSLCVDTTDNELAYLESIHLFVEILDQYFSNVCELDLVFNFHKVNYWYSGIDDAPQYIIIIDKSSAQHTAPWEQEVVFLSILTKNY